MANTPKSKTNEILGDNWNKTFRYMFYVASEEYGRINSIDSVNGMKNTQVTLDLPPQAIGVSIPFASSVVATNDGVLEENNGVVFRTISISGTTGILPKRQVSNRPTAPEGLQRIFPSSNSALTKLSSQYNNLVNSIKGTPAASADNKVDVRDTGYYQFWELHNFFIEYAEAKKANNPNLRLVFSSSKDNIDYICTPVSFDIKRDATSPMLYRYNIVLRAWQIKDSAYLAYDPFYADVPSRNNPLTVRKVLDRLREARNVIQSSTNVIRGVQSDVFDVMNGVNQAILGIKDIVGAVGQLADFLPTLRSNANLLAVTNKNQWTQVIEDNREAYARFKKTYDAISDLGSQTGESFKVSAGAAIMTSLATVDINTKISPTGETQNQDKADPTGTLAIAPILDNPELSDNISLADLGTLPESVQKQIDTTVEASKNTNSGDIRQLVDKLAEMSDNLAYASGAMDPVYAETFGLPVPVQGDSTREPNEDDIILSASIEESKDILISTVATGDIFPEKRVDPFLLANDYVEPEETFRTPISAFAVTVQRGMTLDKMAQVYLGDAARSREIALLNNLRAPYIDEQGFTISLTLPTGRSFLVKDNSKLAINQHVFIGGTSVPETRRKILSIQDVGNKNFRVIVDGVPNLEKYIPQSSPYVRGRLPGTIGTGDTILIPSPNEADQIEDSRSTPLSDRLSYAEKLFRVDIALNTEGDLDVGSSGDVSRSYGYNNAVQALRLLLETERGELEWHNEYGLDSAIGQKNLPEFGAFIRERIRSAIISDPRFSDATVEVIQDGSAYRVKVEAVGAQGTGLIPLEFSVPIPA